MNEREGRRGKEKGEVVNVGQDCRCDMNSWRSCCVWREGRVVGEFEKSSRDGDQRCWSPKNEKRWRRTKNVCCIEKCRIELGARWNREGFYESESDRKLSEFREQLFLRPRRWEGTHVECLTTTDNDERRRQRLVLRGEGIMLCEGCENLFRNMQRKSKWIVSAGSLQASKLRYCVVPLAFPLTEKACERRDLLPLSPATIRPSLERYACLIVACSSFITLSHDWKCTFAPIWDYKRKGKERRFFLFLHHLAIKTKVMAISPSFWE